MGKSINVSRRLFLKRSSLAATAASGLISVRSVQAKEKAWPRINPEIDNLRVVVCHDTKMIKGSYESSFAVQNLAVDGNRVEANMDKMAKTLARKASAKEAWAAIFRKPVSKNWQEVRCAIKVNCINPRNMPRIAVVAKVSKELMRLGVKGETIVVYDGCHNAHGNNKYSQYIGKELPKGVQVSNKAEVLGAMKLPKMLPGYTTVPPNGTCPADLLDDTVDILVNCAVNKHHGNQYGAVTLCMKNHFGTFHPRPFGHGDFRYLIGINKSDAIVGGDPVRQQLCIVDSLWANHVGGPRSPITGELPPARLVMGTFAPTVDYLVATATWLDWKDAEGNVCKHITSPNTEKFLLEFGYSEKDKDRLKFMEV